MTHRERFLATVPGRSRDRAPYWLYWWVWNTAWERWKREGLPGRFQSFARLAASAQSYSAEIWAGVSRASRWMNV